MYFIIDRMT